jgi:ATP-dependent DNA helicase DinG
LTILEKMNLLVKQCLEPNGKLASVIPEYEFRRYQLEMADDVFRTVTSPGSLLLAEAGTGTGKSLAYLIPVAVAQCRTIVSTGTKNLQEQLVNKDIPLLNKIVDHPVHAILLKGRGNYLCIRRKQWFAENPEFGSVKEKKQWASILRWSDSTDTGDRSELEFLHDRSSLWTNINSRREECLGNKCRHFRDCYLMRLKIRAQKADLIVVNHHLFFADTIFSGTNRISALPETQALIFDEAHLIEETASQFFGVHLSQFQIMDFVKMIRRWKPTRRELKDSGWRMETSLKGLEEGAGLFFSSIPSGIGRFDLADIMNKQTEKMGAVLINRFESLDSELTVNRLIPEEFVNEWRSLCREMKESLILFLNRSEPGMAWWGEHSQSGNSLHAVPIDISDDFSNCIRNSDRSVIMTSATLATNNSFDYVAKRLGIKDYKPRIYPSAFQYKKQGILYLPKHLPDPNDPDFYIECAKEIIDLLNASSGRAFILTTSYSGMNKLRSLLTESIPFHLLVQGDMPKKTLTELFIKDIHSVLLATISFWQGVDIPGESLSAVIIDKLPFASPGDPITKARLDYLRENGLDPFREYQIPSAIMMLKQGLGRLIRTRTDKGLVAVLDHRITTKNYGRKFLQSIPDFCRASNLDDVKNFFKNNSHHLCGHSQALSEP